MASKAASKTKLGAPKFGDAKFINYSLSVEQKAELKKAVFTAEDMESLFDKVTEADYKVSLSYDTYNSCFACFITPKGEKHQNAGLILTARGSTCLKAFKQAMYLHYQLFAEDWTDWYEPTGRDPIDD